MVLEAAVDREDDRQALRRAVRLEFELWDESGRDRRRVWSRDLSTRGVWLETEAPLEPGEFVLMRLRLPVETAALFLTGIVRRSELRGQQERPSGMAVEFVDPDGFVAKGLAGYLAGRPPPLPGRPDPTRAHRELVDVQMNVVFEDCEGDEHAVFETFEMMSLIEDEAFEPVSIGPLLTGGRHKHPADPSSAAA